MNTQKKADLALLLVSLLWGASYYAMDVSLTEISPFMLSAYRFFGAFLIASMFTFKLLRGISKTTIKYAALIGVALFGVYFGATTSVLYTSLSNAGFLCALAVVFTPLLAFVFKKERLSGQMIIVVVMAFVGIALLSITDELTVASGDLLALLASISYAVMILLVDAAVSKPDVNSYHLGVMQLGFTGVYFLILAFFMGEIVIPKEPNVIIAVIFLTVLCTGVAFIVQTIAQKHTTPVRVGIIFSTEPVFAGVVAFAFAGEILSVRGYIGAAIVVSCLFAMEIDFNKIKEKIQGKNNLQ